MSRQDQPLGSRGKADSAAQPPLPKSVSLNPPQHGGWAFVGLPVVVGWTVGGFTLGTFLAGIAFILSFPTLYFVGAWLRYPKRERFVRPLVIWLGLTVLFGVSAIIAAPRLLYWAPPYIVLGLVSLIAAKQKRDRELLNEVFQIIQCSMIVPTLATATGRLDNRATLIATLWVALTLIGSILTVRALIRKKNDPQFRKGAKWFAIVSWAVAVATAGALVGWLPAVVVGIAFAFAWWRAARIQPDTLKPGQLGMIELAFFILVWLAVLSAVLVG